MESGLYEQLFYKALRIRLVEEKIIELYPSDKIQSPVHLSLGQEGVAVGVCEHLLPGDLLFSTCRSHSWYLAKGGDLKAFFAELYGKQSGCCKGKGGSMHLAAPEVGFMGTSAVVASSIPHALGAALAVRRLQKDKLVVTVFGDGATEEGVFHESLNLAALYRLPVILICEDNGFAMHTRPEQKHSYDLCSLVASYGIQIYRVPDGRDFVTLSELMSGLVLLMKTSPGPRFVWVKTYRWKEHVGVGEDYDVGYREKAELEAWLARDPLCIDTDLIAKYTNKIKTEIEEAVAFAEAAPFPTEGELYTYE